MIGAVHGSREGVTTPRPSRKVRHAQNISRMCLVCGRDNPFGLHARFYELAPDEPAAAGAEAADAARRLSRPAPTAARPAPSSSASSPRARSTRATPAGFTAA